MLEDFNSRTQSNSSPIEIASAPSAIYKLAISTNKIVTRAGNWGWLPVTSLIGAVGLLLISTADALSRSGALGFEPLFWAGLVVLIIPVAFRLTTDQATRHERIGLVLLLGVELYLVKVMHSSFAFTLLDEVLHLNNLLEILRTGNVFPSNSIFPVSTQYPGLEIATAALVSITGLNAFDAGLLLVGATRIISSLALFLLFEKISGSTRSAGLAALIYTGAPNYMFYATLYSYETLALPLALLVLYASIRREEARDSSHTAFTVIALLGIIGVVSTHHMSSYFLLAFLVIWTLLYNRIHLFFFNSAKTLVSRKSANSPKWKWRVFVIQPIDWRRFFGSINMFRSQSPAGLAIFAVAVGVFWRITVATLTSRYLTPILGNAINSIFLLITGEESGRQLFRASGGYVAPTWERVIGIGAVFICLIGLPFGLRIVWKYYRNRVVALMLAGAAIAYFGMLGLRFTPAAWETSNRASEFLFIGLAFVLAHTGLDFWRPHRVPWMGRIFFTGCMCVAVMGGLIASWSPWLRLAQPYRVNVGSVVIEPQGLAVANWMLSTLGSNNKIIADTTNGMLMMTYGHQTVFGEYYKSKDILQGTVWSDYHSDILRRGQIKYVVFDHRKRSWDPMTGLYFDRIGVQVFPITGLVELKVREKFETLENVSRVFDSGNITIYDVSAISNETLNK